MKDLMKVGVKLVALEGVGCLPRNVGKIATVTGIHPAGISYRYGPDGENCSVDFGCAFDKLEERFKLLKVTAPEFGPVPESGVMTIRDLSQMLPFQVYQFRRVEDGRAFGKVRYMMATGIPNVYWHNIASSECWCTQGYRMEDGFLMHVDVAGLMRCGAYELVPVYDYPAMPTNMRHAHTDLLTQYYNGDHPNAD